MIKRHFFFTFSHFLIKLQTTVDCSIELKMYFCLYENHKLIILIVIKM